MSKDRKEVREQVRKLGEEWEVPRSHGRNSRDSTVEAELKELKNDIKIRLERKGDKNCLGLEVMVKALHFTQTKTGSHWRVMSHRII